MPRRAPDAARATLYHLLGVAELKHGVRAKYRDQPGFTLESTEVAGRTALLVQGAMSSTQTKWSPRLAELAGRDVSLGNTTAAAALLIAGERNDVWALTFGMGFHLLDQDHVDQRFGLRIAVRTAEPEALQSLTRTTLDFRSKTDRSSIPGGDVLRGFGLGDFGEVVSRLAGSARITGLTAGDGPLTIRGSDSLNLPLARRPTDLIQDLDILARTLDATPRPELDVVENLTVVKGPRATELDALLQSKITNDVPGTLAIGWPFEQLESAASPSTFRIIGGGHRGIIEGVPSLDAIVGAVRAHDGAVLEALKHLRIQAYADDEGEEPVTPQLPARRWLVYEVVDRDRRYCLFNGTWYALDEDYSSRIAEHIGEIFSRKSPITLPDWDHSRYESEGQYNDAIAAAVGAVSLDRRLIRTRQHPRGFEACDLITASGELVHVKHIPASSAVSHLIAQAQVAFEALQFDAEARVVLRERVAAAGGKREWVPERPNAVVLALARDRPVDADTLFTFSQVTLARLDMSLLSAGGTLTTTWIRRS